MGDGVDKRAILGSYIRDMADRLGLRDWTINLMHDPPDNEDLGATVEVRFGRKHANIRVCKQFQELKPDEQRCIIIHELLHCHMDSAAAIVRDDLWEGRQLTQSTYEATWFAYRRHMEQGVDAISESIAPLFPLIEWDDKPA